MTAQAASFDDAHGRRLAGDMEATVRCVELLRRMGVELVFTSRGRSTIAVEARGAGGELLGRVSRSELFDVVASSPDQVQAWASEVRARESSSAARG